MTSDGITVTYASTRPLRMRSVLGPLSHGRRDPCFHTDDSGRVWWATSTPFGPGTARLVQRDGRHEVTATSWGPGAQWLAEAVPTLLGHGDDVASFDPAHDVVREAWRREQTPPVMRTRRPFDACVAAVIEQKVTGIEAQRAWRVLVRRLGEPAPGPVPPGLTVPPTPAAWRAAPDWVLHRAGVTPQRARTLRVVASAASAIERTADASGAAADAVLRQLPGVGVWTSAEVRQRAHGDADAVSFGDFHVAKDICWWLTGERGDDSRLAELLEPYAGHRYRVQQLMELSGGGAPRRGPRLQVPSHRLW